MEFPKKYKCLNVNHFSEKEYSIVPIRFEDRVDIMKWRNEQIYHLRQNKPLTEKDQDYYFKNIVADIFNQEKPNQILFSYLKNNKCIGYGGLVHINWIDKNAEISFIMDTKLEKNEFGIHWDVFLDLIENVAFNVMEFHKIFTYAFNWSNDVIILQNSFNSQEINYQEHLDWFAKKRLDKNANYYICLLKDKEAGLIRFDKSKTTDETVIGILIDKKFRGQKLASKFLKLACKNYSSKIIAYIKISNIASIKTFKNAGFVFREETTINKTKAAVFYYERK